jgi:uncharacterized protein (DUF885 family)
MREREGILPPKFVIHRVLKEMRNFTSVPVRDNILFTALREKMAETNIKQTESVEISNLAAQEIEATVYPTYQRLIRYCEELEPKLTNDDGVWKLPEGNSYYAYLLRSHTTTDLEPGEVHELGLREVARIEGEMQKILNKQGHNGKSIANQMSELGQDPRFRYPNSDEAREQVLKDYQQIIDQADQNLDDLFDVRPKVGVGVERMPAFKEETTPEAYYMPPALGGSRKGVFYINLRNLNEIRKFAMQTLAYHEAIPGHHFQLALALELQGVPTFRKVIPFTAYIEGWALYAEKLAYEQGFFVDPYSQLGYLESELFRAVRLVVDTGIHDQRWTREQAIAYMESHIGQPTESIVTEIERYIVMPAQACAYKIGELKLLELREKVKTALGDKFDLKAFHNIVLQDGSMPLSILEDRIEAYIRDASLSPTYA